MGRRTDKKKTRISRGKSCLVQILGDQITISMSNSEFREQQRFPAHFLDFELYRLFPKASTKLTRKMQHAETKMKTTKFGHGKSIDALQLKKKDGSHLFAIKLHKFYIYLKESK